MSGLSPADAHNHLHTLLHENSHRHKQTREEDEEAAELAPRLWPSEAEASSAHDVYRSIEPLRDPPPDPDTPEYLSREPLKDLESSTKKSVGGRCRVICRQARSLAAKRV